MSPSRPWIGVPTGFDAEAGRHVVDRRYLDAVERAGGNTVILPVPAARRLVSDLGGLLDGVLLPGSPTDVDPARYGEQPHERLGKLFPERDETDFLLLEIAAEGGLPVLGICHGMQTLNVWRGGTLVQDIPSEIPASLAHQNPGRPRDMGAHEIRVEAGSRLSTIYPGVDEVNSFHHQSVREPGRGLQIVARAPDGVVEALEEKGARFVVAVQWHPETATGTRTGARRLFEAFVQAARGRHR